MTAVRSMRSKAFHKSARPPANGVPSRSKDSRSRAPEYQASSAPTPKTALNKSSVAHALIQARKCRSLALAQMR